MLSIKTLDQERASFCLKKVREIKSNKNKHVKSDKDEEIQSNKDKDKDVKMDKFKTAAKNLPSFIISNGLIPTLAFYKSKSEKKEVYDIIERWLKEKELIPKDKDALSELVDKNFNILRLATMEVLALANWLKRIVEIELKE